MTAPAQETRAAEIQDTLVEQHRTLLADAADLRQIFARDRQDSHASTG
jgi:hypothetical protein